MTKEDVKDAVMAFAPLLISLVSLINAYLSLKGMPCIELDNETITQAVSVIAGIVSLIYAWWKNNNVTEDARVSQTVLDFLNKGYISRGEVLDFLEEKLDQPTVEEPEVEQEVKEAIDRSEKLDDKL